jgi:hypothetical protein
MRLRTILVTMTTLMALCFAGCGPSTPEEDQAKREREQKVDKAARKAGSDAYEAGQKAEKAAEDAGKAAKELGKKIEKAGEEAKEGWSDAKREEEAKKTKQP